MTNKMDELVAEWARERWGYAPDVIVTTYDTTHTEGGCETCGYGGDESYTLEFMFYDGDKYLGSREWDHGFSELLSQLGAKLSGE